MDFDTFSYWKQIQHHYTLIKAAISLTETGNFHVDNFCSPQLPPVFDSTTFPSLLQEVQSELELPLQVLQSAWHAASKSLSSVWMKMVWFIGKHKGKPSCLRRTYCHTWRSRYRNSNRQCPHSLSCCLSSYRSLCMSLRCRPIHSQSRQYTQL